MIYSFEEFRALVKKMRSHQKISARTQNPASSNAARKCEEEVDECIDVIEFYEKKYAEFSRQLQPELI